MKIKYTINQGEGLTERQKVRALLLWVEKFGQYLTGGSRYYNPYLNTFSEEQLTPDFHYISFSREGCTEECCY